MAQIGGRTVKDSPCPGCGAIGQAIQMQTMPQPWGPPLVDITWRCPACTVAWETEEVHGVAGSRRTVHMSSGYPLGLWAPEPELPKPPAPAPNPERVISGAVLGYRAWRIKDWQLTGTGVDRAWHPGVNEATCDAGHQDTVLWRAAMGMNGTAPNRHPAPHVDCHCGITALARFTEKDSHWTSADVHGAIEAWSDETPDSEPGRFILHGTGFRAQFGKVVLLAVDDDWPAAKRAAVRALAAEHEADVCKRSHLEDAAKEHGQLVPDEMLEWAKKGDPPEVEPGGYFIPPIWGTQQVSMQSSGMGGLGRQMQQLQQMAALSPASMRQISAAFSVPASRPVAPAKPKPGPKGVSQTLGYPGPPSHGKYRKGERVRDRNGAVWTCAKGGRPGVWEGEAAGS